MTARLMADSITPAAMPGWVSIKAFYVNGRYAAAPRDISAWDGPRVLINVTGNPAVRSNMLDVERYDATPRDVPRWVGAMHGMGVQDLAVYCSRANFGAVVEAVGRAPAGIVLATLDGTVIHSYQGHPLLACQALGAQHTGANFDLSFVWADNWHPAPGAGITPRVRQDLLDLSSGAEAATDALAAYIRNL